MQTVTDDNKFLIDVGADGSSVASVEFKVDGKWQSANEGFIRSNETMTFAIPNGATEVRISASLSADEIGRYNTSSAIGTDGPGDKILPGARMGSIYRVVNAEEGGVTQEVYYKRAFGLKVRSTEKIHNHPLKDLKKGVCKLKNNLTKHDTEFFYSPYKTVKELPTEVIEK